MQALTFELNADGAIAEPFTIAIGGPVSYQEGVRAELDFAGELSGRTLTSPQPLEIVYLDGAFTASVSFGAVWDERDSAIAPTEGNLISMEVSPTLLAGDASSTYFKAVAEGRTYQRLTPSIIIAGRLRAGGLIGAPLETLPPEQRFFAGGGGSARGYDYQSLGLVSDSRSGGIQARI